MLNPEITPSIPEDKKKKPPLWGKNDRLTLRVTSEESQEALDQSLKKEIERFVRNPGEFFNQLEILRNFNKLGTVNNESIEFAKENIWSNFKTSLFVEHYGRDSKDAIDSLVEVLNIPSDLGDAMKAKVYAASEKKIPTLKASNFARTSVDEVPELEMFNEEEAVRMMSKAKVELFEIQEVYEGLRKNTQSAEVNDRYNKVLQECNDLINRLAEYQKDAADQFKSIRSKHGWSPKETEALTLFHKGFKTLLEQINNFVLENDQPAKKAERGPDSKDMPPALGDWSDL